MCSSDLIYKTNADFLLLSIGLFTSGESDSRRPRLPLRLGRRARIERGKAYYRFAFNFSQKITPRSPSLTVVLGKLSRGFEKYLVILSHLRGEHFNLFEQLSTGEEFHLRRSIDATAQQEDIRRTQDEFLDLYLSCGEKPDEGRLEKIREVCARLRNLDPSFRFEPGH